jgi:hypothetical protein
MGIEAIIILTGSAIAIATIGIVVIYSKKPGGEIPKNNLSTNKTTAELPNQTAPIEPPIMGTDTSISSSEPVSNALISEAPPPFPEEKQRQLSIPQLSSSVLATNQVLALPADTTAINAISKSEESAAPSIIVIPAPKRRQRAKRLPSSTVTGGSSNRRKRVSKALQVPTTATDLVSESTTTPGWNKSESAPDNKGLLAAPRAES